MRAALLVLGAVALLLAGCGREGERIRPPGGEQDPPPPGLEAESLYRF